MTDFYRGSFTNLWITLRSDEPLGILDSSYLENYEGLDGYVTIEDLLTGQHFDVPMVEVPSETPSVPHDVFRGAIALSSLPDGEFEIRGRVRDPYGNYTILGAVLNPFGSERVQTLRFRIVPGLGVVVALCPLKINYGFELEPLGFASPIFELALTNNTVPTLAFSSCDCC